MQDETFESKQHDPGLTGTEKKEGGNPAGGTDLSYLRMFEEVSPEELDESEVAEDNWLDMVEALPGVTGELREGKIVKGVVYSVNEKEVILDVGFKSEGTIPIAEFANCDEVKHGDAFDVFLEKMENQDGLIVLSKIKADFLKAWDEIKDSYDSGRVVSAIVDRRIKGGLVVKLMGVDAFLPGSQIALRQVPNLDDMLGEKLECKIIKLNKRRRNIVVSRRVVLEQEREKKKKALLEELEVGQEREGIVKNITDFGAFVDLGGIDGLLHLTDLTWGRVSHPSEVVAIGDKLKVKILDFDRERERISLGLKQLEPDPWKALESKYPPGTRLKGKVRNLTNFGAFIEIEDGIDGLVHISDMSWAKRIRHPSEMVKKGDEIEVVVLEIDSDKRRISLGMKQTRENPWTELATEFSIGKETTGVITRLLDRGAVVELRDDVEGFVPLSHLGIDSMKQPSDYLDNGIELPLKVIKVDPQNKRIVLSVNAYFEGRSAGELAEYREAHPKKITAEEEEEATAAVTAESGSPERSRDDDDYRDDDYDDEKLTDAASGESEKEKDAPVEGEAETAEVEKETESAPADEEPEQEAGSDASSDESGAKKEAE
jgi:small subunit ribosomal protein S1